MKRKEEKQPTKAKLNEMNVQDLNSSLIAFVNEIRKPNGDAYRSDVLLYLTYGSKCNKYVRKRLVSFLSFRRTAAKLRGGSSEAELTHGCVITAISVGVG